MKRFLAYVLLFSLVFSNFGVFFHPLYADEFFVSEIVELTEELSIEEEELEAEDINEEDLEEIIQENIDDEESLGEDEIYIEDEGSEYLENEGGKEENIEDAEDGNITEESQNDIENISNNEGENDVGNEGTIPDNNTDLINLNFAIHAELTRIKGVGNTTAENIIAYREVSLFCDIDELINVKGIGQATLINIKELGYVEYTDCTNSSDNSDTDLGEISDEVDENDIENESSEDIMDEVGGNNIGETQEESENGEDTEEMNNEQNHDELIIIDNNQDDITGEEEGGGVGGENIIVEDELTLINVNEASIEELISIRGIGESIATNIIEYREENLLCSSEDLLEIRGIGPSILSNILEVGYVLHPDCVYDQNSSEIEESNFSIVYEFQRPTDISPIADSVYAYDCDRSRQDCRVNLDYRTSFSSDFPIRNYTCSTDFGFGEITGEEEKCNPNTVIFPLGVHEVSIKVEEKSGEKKVYEQKFTVRNLGYLAPEKRQSLAASSGEKVGKIDISLPRITVQSGLEAMDETGKFFRCLKKDCKINLDYSQRHSSERCLWNFGVGVPNHPTTHTRCNPGIVTFPEGDHELILTVYENNVEANRRELIFFVRNIFDDEIINITNNEITENNKNKENSIIDIGNIEILLQGRIGKEKIYDSENQELRCIGVEKCSVNLIGEIENSKRGLNYIWYKNDEVFFENINPSAEWLETGEYEILLEIYDDDILLGSSIFFVTVEGKEVNGSSKSKKQIDTEPGLFDTLIHDGIEIYDFLADPIGSDMKELIELRNTNSESRDLYGCYLEDRAKRKFRFPEGMFLQAGEYKRFFRPHTKLTLGNQIGRIALFCNNEIVQNIVWETKVREGISYKGKYIGIFQPEYIKSELSNEHYENYVRNVFGFSARSLKYDGLRVSGETFPHSKLEGFIGGQRFFSLTTGASGKYTFTTKNIQPGKHEVDYVLTDMFGELFELKSRSFTIKSGATQFWNTPRPGSTPRVPTLRILSQASADSTFNSIDNSDVLLRRFLLLGVILFIAFIASWHIFTLAFQPSMALRELQVRTKVRTKLIFLLPSN